MRILGTLARYLFLLCFPIFLFTTSLRYAVNEIRLYEYGYDKYNVGQRTDMDRGEYLDAVAGLIDYFNSKGELEDLDFLNEREVAHLWDVRNLIQLCYRLGEITLLYLIGYAAIRYARWRGASWPSFARAIAWGSGITIALLVLLGVGMLFDFDELFWQFHVISFPNELWIMTASDYLPRMFPQGFFYDATLLIAAVTAAEAMVTGGVAAGYLALRRRKPK